MHGRRAFNSVDGTFEKRPPILRMSVHRGRPEVAVVRPEVISAGPTDAIPGRTYRANPASALSTSGRGDCLDMLSPTTALCTGCSRTCRRGRGREDPRKAGPASL